MYTFADHLRCCQQAAQRRETLVQWVQVKVAGISACGRIQGLWAAPSGVDLWRVALEPPFSGLSYHPPGRVVQCSGVDGHCVCAGEPDGAACEARHAVRFDIDQDLGRVC